MGKSVPPLDDPDMILRGAAHYEIGCRSCHGSPALGSSRIAQRMLPEPPHLPDIIGKRKPAELFQVVKHGIKFTGMPAWPAADRDDEVWAMVAFLKKMPELDAEAYLQLARGDAVTAQERPSRIPDRVARSCARCHGEDGIARGSGAFPHLAGQRFGYLRNSLVAYASGDRQSGTMGPVAAELSDTEIEDLARYYATLPPPTPPPANPADTEAIRRGEVIATRGSREDRLPSCNDCHAADGRRINDSYPSLGGQPADFLVRQLEIFKAKARGGTGFSHLMHPTADRLDEGQIRDLALYFQALSSK
jgi:cytochrome c553